jgi:hypothetical protein
MTKPPITSRIRDQLRVTDDGLTCAQLTDILGAKRGAVYQRLCAMPDTFIDRWVYPPVTGRPAAVWCVVVPPPDCPPPEKKG